jgi:hypothetical protein
VIYSYRAEILDELARHGLKPKPGTHPEFLRTAVRDLYLYEIRALRDRCRAGDFPTSELSARVIALRARYPILSIPIYKWTE